MSSVDSRVVQMKFDDSEFDKGANRAIETLSKLDNSLVLKNGAKGLEKIQQVADKFNVNSMNGQVDSAQSKFQQLATSAGTVLSGLASKFATFGKVGLSSVTGIAAVIGGMAWSGGMKRALNLEAANFQLKGLLKSTSAVQKVMDDVSYAVDGTRYGLDAAAKAAGQLAASNIKAGDEMKNALRGISGVASMTNSEYEDIANVFTRVAGNGRLMAIDLQSISSRGLNAAAALTTYLNKNTEARKAVIKMGLAAKSGSKEVSGFAKQTKLTEKNIRSLISAGAIDFKTFSKAMNESFGEQATKANETFTGALANTKAALSRIGAEIATPYIENTRKVLVEVIPTLNAIKKTFVGFGEVTTKKLKDTTMGLSKAPKEVQKALAKTKKYVDKSGVTWEKHGKKVKKVNDKIPSDVRKALKKSEQYVDKSGAVWTKAGKKYSKTYESMYKKVVTPSDKIQKKLEKLNTYTDKAGNKFKRVGKVYKQTSEVISKSMSKVPKNVEKHLKKAKSYTDKAGNTWTKSGKKFTKTFSKVTDEVVKKPTKEMKKALKTVKSYTDAYGNVYTINKKGQYVKKSNVSLFTTIQKSIEKVRKKLVEFLKSLNENGVMSAIRNFAKAFTYGFLAVHNIISAIMTLIKPFATAILSAFAPLGDSNTILSFAKSIEEFTASLKNAITNSALFNDVILPLADALGKLVGLGIGAAANGFTFLAEKMSGAVSSLLDVFQNLRNKIAPTIENVKIGISNLVEAFWNIVDGIGVILSPLKDLWDAIAQPFIDTFAEMFKPIEEINDPEIKRVAESLKPLFDTINDFLNGGPAEGFKKWTESVLEWSKSFKENAKASPLLQNLIDKIKGFTKAAAPIVAGALAKALSLLTKAFELLGKAANFVKERFGFLAPIVQDLAGKAFEKLSGFISNIGEKLASINWEPVISMFGSIKDHIKEFVSNISDGQPIFDKLVEFIGNIVKAFKDFKAGDTQGLSNLLGDLKDFIGSGIESGVSGIAEAFQSLSTGLSNAINSAKEINTIFDGSSSSASKTEESVENTTSAWDAFKDSVQSGNLLNFFGVGITGAVGLFAVSTVKNINSVSKSIKGISKTFEAATKPITTLHKTIAGFQSTFAKAVKYDNILKVAGAIGILALSLKLLSTVDMKSIAVSTVALSALMGVILIFERIIEKKMDSKKFEQMANGLIKIAASMLIFAAAMAIIASMRVEDIVKAFTVIAGLMAGLTIFFAKGVDKKAANIGTQLLKMASSILVFAIAIAFLAALPVDVISNGIIRLGAVLLLLAGFLAILKKLKAGSIFVTMKGIAVALIAMAASLALLGNLGLEHIGKGLLAIGGILLELVAFAALMKKFSGGRMTEVSVTILALGGAILLIAGALAILAQIPFTAIIGACIALAAGLAILGAVGILLSKVAMGFLVFAAAIVVFGIGIAAVGLGLMAFAAGLINVAFACQTAMSQLGNVITVMLAIGVAGALMIPAAIAFALIGVAALAVGAAFLLASVGVLALAAGLSIIKAVGADAVAGMLEGLGKGIESLIPAIADLGDHLVTLIVVGVVALVMAAAAVVLAVAVVIAAAGLLIFNAALQGLAEIGADKITETLVALATGIVTVSLAALVLGVSSIALVPAAVAFVLLGAACIVLSAGLGMLSGAITAITNAFMVFSGTAPESANQAAQGISNALGGLVNVIGGAANAIGGFLNGIGDALFSTGQQADQNVAEGINSSTASKEAAKKEGADIMQGAKEGVEENKDNFAQGFLTSLQGGTDSVAGSVNFDSLISGFTSGGSESTKGFADGIDPSIITDKIGDTGDISMDKLAESFSSDKPNAQLESTFGDLVGTFDSGSSKLNKKASSLGKGLDSNMSSGIKGNKLKSSINKTVDSAISSGNSRAKKASKIGKTLASSAASGAKSSTSTAEKGGEEVGSALVSGAVSGMNSHSGNLYTTATQIVSNAISKMKAAAKIHSPSKETMEIGNYLDRGLIVGMQQLAGKVNKQGEAVANNAVNGISSGMKALSLSLDEIDYSPTIRPVMDLSAIEAGAEAANSIWSDQYYGGIASGHFNAPSAFGNTTSKVVTNNITLTLDYNAGTTANDMLNSLARALEAKNIMEA